MAVGEDWAAARGVHVSRLILTGYLLGSFVTGSVDRAYRAIGFVA